MSIEQELAHVVPERETILTIGVFDGVHRGHRYLLERLNQRARERGLLSGVVTFTPHPQSLLQPQGKVHMLSDVKSRIKSLRGQGIDLIAVLSFTPELAQLSARDFVAMLKKYLKMRILMIGPDFALGKGRKGDIKSLRLLGQEMSFDVEVVSFFSIGGEIVSSTTIRRALAEGDTDRVGNLLGRHFSLAGHVIAASKRGRTLGFPTANLDISPEQALPKNGVYATITQIGDRQYASVTNIGTRPTFGESERVVETHIGDYKGNLNGTELEVSFIQRLRGEEIFPSPQELKEQISKDIEKARAVVRKQND